MLLVWLACLLVSIRFVAGIICSTCILPEEVQHNRLASQYGVEREPCSHGEAQASPIAQWACTVTQDETAFILPDIPRLPVIVSVLVLWLLLLFSYARRPVVPAHGRGPPLSAC